MTIEARLRAAVRNNADWCDTICRAHGAGGEVGEGMWFNPNPVPRFYPNAVTLDLDTASQLERIAELDAAGLVGEWGVKDSFAALDLAPLGFRPLFEAQWLWREPSAPPVQARLRSTEVIDARGLAAWEAAWSGTGGENDERIFPPSLLAEQGVRFLSVYDGDRLIAGAIANRSGDVVGMSNVFTLATGAHLRAACVAAVIAAFPGMPIVGYEAGDDLADALTVGFTAIGPLRVWVRQAPV